MILYFTGTGNSRYIAKKIAEKTNDSLICINDRIKDKDYSTILVKDRLIFVTPTYAWRIPRIVKEWIEKTEFLGARKTWFIMSCGSEIGNAGKYNKDITDHMGLIYMGTVGVKMPENYIAMFPTPGKEEISKIMESADTDIENIAEFLQSNGKVHEADARMADKIMSGAINNLFYPLFVKANAFKADDRCIGCGKCAELCPLNNIKLKNGRPVWGKDCTHCMACICSCPTSAIEYGKKSVGKERYLCEK